MWKASRGVLVPEGNLDAFAAAMPRVLQPRDQRTSIAAFGTQFTWQRAADEYHAVLSRAVDA